MFMIFGHNMIVSFTKLLLFNQSKLTNKSVSDSMFRHSVALHLNPNNVKLKLQSICVESFFVKLFT